ncbi:TPA: ead/Ea22-like family protein [Salmonella enterica]
MTIDKRALREVAEKATPGNWRRTSSLFNGITVTPFSLCGEELTLAHTVEKRDAEFIAAANPATVLALLDELEHYKSREERVTKLVLDNSTSWDALYKKLEAAEKRIAELENSETQLINERDAAESALNDAYKAVMGQAPEWSNWFSFENAIDEIELVCELWRNQTDDVIQFRQRIQELEAKLETADKLQDSAFRDGLKAGFSYGQTDDQYGFTQCMSAYSTHAGIGIRQQEDSDDSDVGSRNQPGMVVAIHIDAGDFVKVKGQVFEVEETDFDDHDVTLWFVGGNALKCAAGCPVEVVSAPVAAGIKVKGE